MCKGKYSVLVIDDEKDSIDLIETLIISKKDNFDVIGKTTDPMEGLRLILAHKPDIVMLDIEMPQVNGFKLLEILGNFDFQLIFITAYDQYAIKAFKNKALDYILKPINIEELYNALDRASDIIDSFRNKISYSSNESKKIVVPTNFTYEFIEVYSIIRIEADGSYAKILLNTDKRILVSKKLKDIEIYLNDERFFRTHRSHIINIDYIQRLEKNMLIMNNEDMVPISRANYTSFKELVEEKFINIRFD